MKRINWNLIQMIMVAIWGLVFVTAIVVICVIGVEFVMTLNTQIDADYTALGKAAGHAIRVTSK